MAKRTAFTLIEVLISLALLGIILPVLYSAAEGLQTSNEHLFGYVEASKEGTRVTRTLFLDIVSSDANLSIQKDEFSRLCISETKNSLYGLPLAKVCWVVAKEENTLVRVEGNGFTLPLKLDDKVEADAVMKHIEIFDIYQQKDKVLVFLKQDKKEPVTFMVQGVEKFVEPKKKKRKRKHNQEDANTTTTTTGTNIREQT